MGNKNQKQSLPNFKSSARILFACFALFFTQHTSGFFSLTSVLSKTATTLRSTKQISKDLTIITGFVAAVYFTVTYNPFNIPFFRKKNDRKSQYKKTQKQIKGPQEYCDEQSQKQDEYQEVLENQLDYLSKHITELSHVTAHTQKDIINIYNKLNNLEDNMKKHIEKAQEENRQGQSNLNKQLSMLQETSQTIQTKMLSQLQDTHNTQERNTACIMQALTEVNRALIATKTDHRQIEEQKSFTSRLFLGWLPARTFRAILPSSNQKVQSGTNTN